MSDTDPQDGPGPAWVESAVLPHLPYLRSLAYATDALEQAAYHRKGVPLIAPPGYGKTYALRHARREFERLERARLRADRTYAPRALLPIGVLRGERYVDLLQHFATNLLGAPLPPAVRGRRKSPDELRVEFLTHCLELNVAVLTIEDGEHVSDVVLDLLRDLISDGEHLAQERAPAETTRPSAPTIAAVADAARADGAAPAPSTGAVRAAAAGDAPPRPAAARPAVGGLGVLLVGTTPLLARLTASPEAGQRWLPVVEVPPVERAVVPRVYASWFPGFAAAIAAMGEPAWAAFLEGSCLRGRPAPIRLLHTHARRYLHYMAHRRRQITTLAEVPFDRDAFLRIWNGLDGGNARGK